MGGGDLLLSEEEEKRQVDGGGLPWSQLSRGRRREKVTQEEVGSLLLDHHEPGRGTGQQEAGRSSSSIDAVEEMYQRRWRRGSYFLLDHRNQGKGCLGRRDQGE